jgi:phosphatidylglycerophosphate synthase
MFDARLQRPVQALLRWPAERLTAMGVRADIITLVGFGLGLAGACALALGWYRLGLVLFLANRLADGLDGAVARLQGPTDRGAFLDVTLDFVLYALVVFGFALADPTRNALPAAALLCAFMGTATSFLAFAVLAERRGLPRDAFPSKGIHYLGGLTEGFETILVVALMCLWPAGFPVLAWSFAAACCLTTLTRWAGGWQAFGAAGTGR